MIPRETVSLMGEKAPYEIWLNAPLGSISPEDALALSRLLVQAAAKAQWGGPGLGIDGPPKAAARPVPGAELQYCACCGLRRPDKQSDGDFFACSNCGYSSWMDLDRIIFRVFRSLRELWKREERHDPIIVGGGR